MDVGWPPLVNRYVTGKLAGVRAPCRTRAGVVLPKSLIEWPVEQENNLGTQHSA
jgi:hypothetical protein